MPSLSTPRIEDLRISPPGSLAPIFDSGTRMPTRTFGAPQTTR